MCYIMFEGSLRNVKNPDRLSWKGKFCKFHLLLVDDFETNSTKTGQCGEEVNIKGRLCGTTMQSFADRIQAAFHIFQDLRSPTAKRCRKPNEFAKRRFKPDA